uniref:Integrase catalytic domain-containing protein n=1 Tax=Tanacetum cinerariifolium TaxID=118510 RepID=A0A6L2JVF3_TANCI|nr:hypothetical protein [Tanacetum cinerariifolium]
MTLETHNWSPFAHQELHKIIKDEIFPIVNQVDARVQNFEIQFLKEAAKFVRDFKSLVKEADEYLAKHKALKLEIERLLRAVVSQDIMSVVQNNSVDETSNLQTELELTSNSTPTPQGSKVVKNVKVIAPGMFRINPFKPSREEKHVPNRVRASVRTNQITISQPPVITKKVVNYDLNGLSSIGVDNTKQEGHNLGAIQRMIGSPLRLRVNGKSKVVCAMCKKCLISVNHDVCLVNYVNGMTSRGKVIASSESESQSDCSKGDNACTSNPMEPTIKQSQILLFLWQKFLGTVRFGNDHVAAILGQFCDSDLEVAFRRNACFIINLEGVDLLSGNHTTNLYTINRHEMASASPICLMACASSTKSWLGYQRLSHLNFDTINDLAKNDLVFGLPKFKYHKEHICPFCEQGKSKRASHPPKLVQNSRQRLHFLHMDLCGPMRIASINGKQYVLVIVDDYSRYTWVHFLRSKDEAPKVIKTFLKRITVLLQSPVVIIKADNGIEFKNHVLKEYFDSIATACFTQNRSIIHCRFNKTPYKLINGRKLDISFLHVFEALCYPKNDHEDIGKLGARGDIGFFIDYSADSYAYRVYNRRKNKIIETMNVTFDKLSAIAFEQRSELDLLFEAMYDDYISGQPLAAPRTVPAAQAPQARQTLTISTSIVDIAPTQTNSSSQATNFPITSQDVDGPNSQQQHAQQQGNQAPIQPETVSNNVLNAMFDENTVVNPFANPSTSATESSYLQYVDPSNMHTFYQPYPHEFQWTKDHPLEQVIREPSRPVLTRNQLRSDGDMCMYALTVSTMEPKNVKEAMTDPAWIESMQEEHLQFKRLDVLVLVPAPNNITSLTLKWLFKNKHDEEQTVIQNKSRLVGTTDPTLFIRRFVDDILVVQVFVDDIIFGSIHHRYTQLFSDLRKSLFEMSMMGEMTFFLGLQVNQSLCGIFINQSNYVLEILKKYGIESCDPIGTPMEIKDKLDLDQNGTPVDATKYRSMIGALMYLTSSRPNIVQATCLCARYQAKPTEKHLKEVKRILRYLRGTINTGLWYTKDSEAEYVSLFAFCAQVLWMRTQLTDYGFQFNKIPIYCDLKSAIAISCNPVQHSRIKHTAVRYRFKKEHVEKGTIELYFVKTDYKLADVFTKALPVDRFNYLDQTMALQPHSSRVKIQDLMLNQQSYIQDESLFYQSLLKSLMYKHFLKRNILNKIAEQCGGLEWLFDIDALSKLMNYAPVPIDGPNKYKHGPSQANESDNQERPNAESSTKTVDTAGPANTATPTYADYPSNPLMRDLEDTKILDDAYDDIDKGAKADYYNLEIVISVSPIPFTRIHKDYQKEQIIREINSAVHTRKMAKQNDEGLINFINKQRRTNHKEFQNCLFACFLSQMEPKKVTQALNDESWVEAMQEELL